MLRHAHCVKHAAPPPHSRDEVARRLKLTRKALGLRTTDVARATGIANNTWSQYEKARRYPELAQILRFVERFSIPLDWIYRGVLLGLPTDLAKRIIEIEADPEKAAKDGDEA